MRESFDLFTKVGRKCFFMRGPLGDEWARTYVLQDTLGKYACRIIGHGSTFETQEDNGEPPRHICKRCCKEA